MNSKKISLAKLGERICNFAKNNGCEVNFCMHPKIISKQCLRVACKTLYWETKFYNCSISGKKRAFRQFARSVLHSRSPLNKTYLDKALEPVVQTDSAEELELKLTVMGF